MTEDTTSSSSRRAEVLKFLAKGKTAASFEELCRVLELNTQEKLAVLKLLNDDSASNTSKVLDEIEPN